MVQGVRPGLHGPVGAGRVPDPGLPGRAGHVLLGVRPHPAIDVHPEERDHAVYRRRERCLGVYSGGAVQQRVLRFRRVLENPGGV